MKSWINDVNGILNPEELSIWNSSTISGEQSWISRKKVDFTIVFSILEVQSFLQKFSRPGGLARCTRMFRHLLLCICAWNCVHALQQPLRFVRLASLLVGILIRERCMAAIDGGTQFWGGTLYYMYIQEGGLRRSAETFLVSLLPFHCFGCTKPRYCLPYHEI